MAFAWCCEREKWTVPGLAVALLAATWALTRGHVAPKVQLATQTHVRDAAMDIRTLRSQLEMPTDDLTPDPREDRGSANATSDPRSRPPGSADTFAFPSPAAQAVIDDAHAAIDLIGKDPAANDHYVAAFSDRALSPDDRRGLLHDLGTFGTTAPTAQDLPVIDGRLTVVDQLARSDWDEVTTDAIDDARQSLVDLRDAIVKT